MIALLATIALSMQDADPYTFKAPEGWRSEKIPFPLPFAKDIERKGHEDLRFAPGMFKADAPDYFSYAFVFWLEGKVELDAKAIEQDLTKYYKGLCGAVSAGKKLDFDLSKIAVTVKKLEKKGNLGGEDADAFQARIDWYDPFVTGKPLTLHLSMWTRAADGGKRTCLFALASPKERTGGVWDTLGKIHADFKAPK